MSRATLDNADLVRAASAASALARRRMSEAFTADDLNSRPTPAQNEILRAASDVLIRIVRAGNQSGKSSVCARDFSWIMNREHPHLDVRKTWGDGPLLGIIAGQDRLQVETNLWARGVKPLLADPTMWKEHRPSGSLMSATHRKTGDTIVFLSHNNASPDDIKHMQSYAAHVVWCDEMPKHAAVLEELTRRIDARRGRMMVSFTQKYRNDAIRRAIDNLDPTVSRLFRLRKLDNPLYADRRDEELAKIAHLSPEMQRAILEGDWIESSSRIYLIDRGRVVVPPTNYGFDWPHVLVADPATESKLGMTIWAMDPVPAVDGAQKWWCVHASYVEGVYVPTSIVREVERRAEGLNIVKRIYDTAAPWFRHTAADMGYTYSAVPEKSNSKQDMIAALQEGLGRDAFLAPGKADLLLEEFENYERSEVNPDKIQHASKFHLIDTAHYFYKCKPDIKQPRVYQTWWDWLAAQKRLAREQQAVKRAKQIAAAKRNHPRPIKFRSWR